MEPTATPETSSPGITMPPGINAAKVTDWLVANVVGARAPFTFTLIAGGRSNLTYKVTGADGSEFVLRRPPLGNVLATAHDMGREHRIIAALGPTTVPVAPALGMCDDVSVNDAPFYVMGYVDGLVLASPEAGLAITPAMRAAASESLIDVLVTLHSIEPSDVGLGELGRREGYIERQLKRWAIQWEKAKTRELPVMEQVHSLLEAKRPPQVHTGIVHGDYRLGNCLVSKQTGRVAAVLDWELCTLGDILADVGYLMIYWNEPGAEALTANDPSGSEGFPSKKELLARYSAATGRDLSGIAYYEAFSCWRLASIAEGVLARYKAGVMGDDAGFDTQGYDDRTRALAERALVAIEAL